MKILFSTAMAPLPTWAFGWNDSLTDGMSQRFTKGQGLFTMHGHQHHNAVHILAQNVRCPSDVLEHPRREDLVRYLRRGYDYLAISFMTLHTGIVREMCRIAREVAPRTKIILGGHGSLAWRTLPKAERERLADHVCFGEGVRFLRELLGDEPVDRPVRQRLMPTCSYSLPWVDRFPGQDAGMIVSGLGCPAGCDFCPTTTLYGRKRLPVASPAEILSEAKRYYRLYPHMVEMVLVEEDHFAEREHLLELSRLAAEDREFGLSRLGWFTFGSISSIDKWSPEEIARSGVSTVFVGVESKFAPDRGYAKRSGDARDVLKKLHHTGVASMAAWMGGFDFHTRDNIREDLEYFVSCYPTYNQLSRVCPFPGTQLWKQLRAEGRLERVPWERVHFYGGGGLRPANMEEEELDALLLAGYRRLYESCGPTVMRFFEVQLNGLDFCRSSADPILRRDKAERHARLCHDVFPLTRACADHAPNGKVRAWIGGLVRRYVDALGPPTRGQRALGRFLATQAGLYTLLQRFRAPTRDPYHEPCKVYEYRQGHWRLEGRPYRTVYPRVDPVYRADRVMQHLRRVISGGVMRALDAAFSEDTSARMGPVSRKNWPRLFDDDPPLRPPGPVVEEAVEQAVDPAQAAA